ncbi:unnamed protein product [Ectocarpus fasciculatus]
MAATDRVALVAVFRSTSGPIGWKNINNWNTTAELSSWYGVKVDGQGRVVELNLGGLGLRGTSALLLAHELLRYDAHGLPRQFIEL